ncbi:glycosyl hydrolase family 38 protein [Ostertagia ostertagi]
MVFGCQSEHFLVNSGGGNSMSGAYLFLPNGEATVLPHDVQEFVPQISMLLLFQVVNGPIMKKVFVVGPQDLEILQVYTLALNSPSIEITNEVDIRYEEEFDTLTAMRMKYTNQSDTDCLSRRQLDKLPLQAHFYPMPSAAYIEDTSSRLSLHGNQPLGVSSLKAGQLEVMLDRRLAQDDERGLFQGVTDNHRTLSRFRLLVEPLSPPDNKNLAQERLGFHSMVGLAQSAELHYPPVRMISSEKPGADSVSGMSSSLPCDVHVVSLRTLAGPTNYNGDRMASPKNEAALILHRSLTECRSKLKLNSDCDRQGNPISPKTLFPSVRSIKETSLTLLYEGKETTQVTMQPQDVTSVKLSW